MASKRVILTLACLTALMFVITGCGSSSSSSNPTTPPVDTSPPALPNGLSVDFAPRQQAATITWEANVTDTDLAGYLVYRGAYDREPIALVSVPQQQNYYTDNDIEGHGRLLTYYIYAVDTNDNVSAAATIVLNLEAAPDPVQDRPMMP